MRQAWTFVAGTTNRRRKKLIKRIADLCVGRDWYVTTAFAQSTSSVWRQNLAGCLPGAPCASIQSSPFAPGSRSDSRRDRGRFVRRELLRHCGTPFLPARVAAGNIYAVTAYSLHCI